MAPRDQAIGVSKKLSAHAIGDWPIIVRQQIYKIDVGCSGVVTMLC